jgi:hypothetical protein
VTTVNDFGFQSEPATHPELLEWLAHDFVQQGWQIKRLHKMIVLSRVYQSTSRATADVERLDPENKYLSHVPKRRLEAEAIRDNALAVAGLLDRTMYGEGTLDESMKRRSIYFRVKRADMIPMLQVFDWPDSQTSCGVRPTTTVAPQALLFLNSPQVKTWAAGFAARLAPEKTRSAQVALAYRIALGREARESELQLGTRFIDTRGLTAYCQALLGLNELIYID